MYSLEQKTGSRLGEKHENMCSPTSTVQVKERPTAETDGAGPADLP